MGKNWKVPKTHGAGRSFTSDLASCRGHSIVVATCDNVREREACKELINLLNEAIDTIYPDIESNNHVVPNNIETSSSSASSSMSIKQLLDEEIKQVQASKPHHNKSSSAISSQRLVSIKTDINCVVLIKILKHGLCPIKLVEEIFNRVEREKKPYSKNLVRLIPLKHVFFPRTDELLENMYAYMMHEYPGIILSEAKDEIERMRKIKYEATSSSTAADDDDDETHDDVGDDKSSAKRQRVDEYDTIEQQILQHDQFLSISSSSSTSSSSATSYPSLSCELIFKARNHNLLTKSSTLDMVTLCMPPFIHLTYLHPQARIVVEAIKSICGISLQHNYDKYLEFNLRKFQAMHNQVEISSRVKMDPSSTSSSSTTSSSSSENQMMSLSSTSSTAVVEDNVVEIR